MPTPDYEVYAQFGRLLKEARTRVGMSQKELAHKIGNSTSSLSSMEAGRQQTSLARLYRIAAELRVEPEALLPKFVNSTRNGTVPESYSPVLPATLIKSQPDRHQRWVTQTKFSSTDPSDYGNCTEAAVASILGLPIEDVPDFRADGAEATVFWEAFKTFLNRMGYEVLLRPGNCVPDCLYLADGPAKRGVNHMVIMRAGKLVWDPHPDRTGLNSVANTWLLVPYDPAPLTQRVDDDPSRP